MAGLVEMAVMAVLAVLAGSLSKSDSQDSDKIRIYGKKSHLDAISCQGRTRAGPERGQGRAESPGKRGPSRGSPPPRAGSWMGKWQEAVVLPPGISEKPENQLAGGSELS